MSIPFQRERAQEHLDKLVLERKWIDIKEKRRGRSLPQNAYFHSLCGLFGIETGYTKDEAKVLFKRECSWMRYEKKNEWYLKSTSSLSKDEMRVFIEFVLIFASKQGIRLPSAEEYREEQSYFEQQLDANKSHL